MAVEPYTIKVSPGAEKDIKSLRLYDQKIIVEGIETHLGYEPTKVSKTRIKEMVQPFWCQYRLRIEDFRVYYDVNQETRIVTILRILEKGQAETPQGPNHETD